MEHLAETFDPNMNGCGGQVTTGLLPYLKGLNLLLHVRKLAALEKAYIVLWPSNASMLFQILAIC